MDCVICKYVDNWENTSGDDALKTVKKKELLTYAVFLVKRLKMVSIRLLKMKNLFKYMKNVG